MNFKLNRLTVYYLATYYIFNVPRGIRMDIREIAGSSPVLTTSLILLCTYQWFAPGWVGGGRPT